MEITSYSIIFCSDINKTLTTSKHLHNIVGVLLFNQTQIGKKLCSLSSLHFALQSKQERMCYEVSYLLSDLFYLRKGDNSHVNIKENRKCSSRWI